MRLVQRARAERCQPERGRKDTRTHMHTKKTLKKEEREREREGGREREREREWKINWTKGMTSRQSVRKSFEQRLEEFQAETDRYRGDHWRLDILARGRRKDN